MKGTFKKVLAMALAMTMAAGVLTGCGGKILWQIHLHPVKQQQPEVKQQAQQVLQIHLRMPLAVIRVPT